MSFVDMLLGKENNIKSNDEPKKDDYQIEINIEDKKINKDRSNDEKNISGEISR